MFEIIQLSIFPAAYLAFVTIASIARPGKLLPAYVHGLWFAAAGWRLYSLAPSETLLSVGVAAALFIVLVWTGMLSRSLTFGLPVMTAAVPLHYWLPVYGASIAFVVIVACAQLVRKMSRSQMVATATLAAGQPFRHLREEARIVGEYSQATVPVTSLSGIGLCLTGFVAALFLL